MEERTAALRDTIGQLEAFSYSVSHDMRGPLRAMSSFATLLADEYAEKLDDEGRNYLQRIVNGALRLDRLIKDVLQYSQLARERLTLEPINIERLFAEVIDHYPDLAQRKQHIIIQPPCAGTTVLANPAAMTQVVSNLLTNALKFVPPGQLPAVQIICETRDDRIRVIIEDNGIGIAPEYQNRIFGVFERLHTGEYAGTGIGLSIVKKAIERMKGTVGLHSEPGKGSRFWFELLKVEDVG
ncbi:MAG TPA: HAMP domain-containing sensor histidine kinase [Candidatus Acidoferrum sp.]|nr:HAMP domain-containing sensor histidine kinase [Candidatus Acidoferrum sp.]